MSEDYNFLRSFTFDDKETKHLFQIAQVRLPFLSKDNEYLKIGNADGKHYKGSSLGDLTISIDGFIIEDNSRMSVSDTIDELVKIVNSDKPKKLVLDALDDRYFLGVFNGVQEYDATNLKYTPLTLNFDVPEAFARAINIKGYTNTLYSDTGNLVLDSEFQTTEKFWKPFSYRISEKYLDSNILQTDFTKGYPIGAKYGLNYVQLTDNTRRRIKGLKKGDKVAGKVMFRFKELGIDLTDLPDDTIVATVHLDEVGGTPFVVKHIHTVDVTKKDIELNTFKELGAIFTIQSNETTHINLTYGFMGLSLFEITQPLLIYKPTATNIKDVVYVKSKNTLTDTITVSNTGTYKTPISAEFTINGESGVVGLLNGNNGGVLQFGNPNDVDGKASKKNENVLELTFNGNGPTGFDFVNSEFTTYYPILSSPQIANVFSGSFNMASNYQAATPVFQTEKPLASWNGPSGVSNIPVGTSNNRGQAFGFFTRFDFNDKNIKNSRGRIECAVMDNTGKPYINIVLRDSSATSSDLYLEGIYKGVKLWEIPIKKSSLKTTKFELTIMRQDTYIKFSLLEIKTMGTTTGGTSGVTSSYKDHTFYYNLVEPDTTPVYKAGVWMMRYSDTRSTDIFTLDDMQFRWYNTDVWTNISNTFQDGDNVTINVAERTLYINGAVNTDLNVLGNEWSKFYIGLGETTIQPIVSSFSNTPVVVINVQDKFI